MDSYRFLSAYYDRFTDDVGYAAWADFFQEIFSRAGLTPHLIVDLACGTGSLSAELARRGYEMIGVDASPEMLMQAMNNTIDIEPRPIFLNQRMEELDLYGTVDACLCCLDSVNYITDPHALRQAFQRVELFLEPGGIFIFDVNTRKKFSSMHGECYVREDEDVFCVWQVDFDGQLCHYDFDIFSRAGKRWDRAQEEHAERYYPLEDLEKMLLELGFVDLHIYPELRFSDCSRSEIEKEDRAFISARKRNTVYG